MAITTVYKAKLGFEDLHLDTGGTGSTVSVKKSDGNSRSVRRLNASHMPSTTVTRAKTRIGTGTPASSATNADAHIQELYDDLAKIGEPDDSTVEISSGILQVKDDGITAAKLKDDAAVDANRAVTTNHIRDDAITAAKIATGAVDTDEIAAGAVDTDELAADAVDGSKIADDAVDSEHIANYAVDRGHLNLDGDGDSESYPQAYIVAYGTHSIAGGASTESESVSIAEAGDFCMVTMTDIGNGATVHLVSASLDTGDNEIDYEFSADPGASTAQYVIFRPTA
jgi:hypothetical protein